MGAGVPEAVLLYWLEFVGLLGYLECPRNSNSDCPYHPSSCSIVFATIGLLVIVVHYATLIVSW